MDSRTYKVGRSTITLIFGDITTSKAEVLVSSDDYYLSMGGGVSAAIRRAGGSRIAQDASKLVPATAGDVVVSSAGDLHAKYVFHAITIGEYDGNLSREIIVRQTTRKCLELLSALDCRSIAFPAIGAGAAHIKYEVVASEMAGTLVEFLLDAHRPFNIELYLFDKHSVMNHDDFFMFFEAFAARSMALTPSKSNELAPPIDSPMFADQKQANEAQRRHQIYTMLRHLDARRSQIEEGIVEALVESTASVAVTLPELKVQLNEIQSLRQSYEAELTIAERPATSIRTNSVFLSSTSIDLKPHRQAVRSVIDKLQFTFIGMEEFSPTSQAPADLIRRKVVESKIYLAVLGMRYGYVDPGTGLSMTELEYHQAIASGKNMLLFVMDQNAPITANMVENEPTRYAKLLDFKDRVMKAHTCGMFTDPNDLAQKAESALKELGLVV